jgi:hypothetical protein
MDEEDIVGSAAPELTREQQLIQYAQLGGYFIAVYILCYLLCRLIRWERLGRAAALVQGLVLIAAVVVIYALWALRLCRIEDGYDLVKAFGIGFLTLLIAIGGCFHGEHGRVRSARRYDADLTPETPRVEAAPVETDLEP